MIHQGLPVVFTNLGFAPSILQLDDDPKIRLSSLPKPDLKETYIIDITDCLTLIESHDRDDEALLIDLLNILFDLVSATRVQWPKRYQSALFRLADHLTYARDYGDFLEQHRLSRRSICNGIRWCLGAILTGSIIVTSQSQLDEIRRPPKTA